LAVNFVILECTNLHLYFFLAKIGAGIGGRMVIFGSLLVIIGIVRLALARDKWKPKSVVYLIYDYLCGRIAWLRAAVPENSASAVGQPEVVQAEMNSKKTVI